MKKIWSAVVLAPFIGWASISAHGQSLQLVSIPESTQHSPSGGNGDSWAPIMSPDGRYVLFGSTANNLLLLSNAVPLPARTPAVLNVFLRDRRNQITTLVSVNLLGNAGGNGDSLPLALSTNGQYVLFESSASDLVTSDTNGSKDIFMRDMAAATTVLVSVSTNGVPGNAESRSAVMTPDAREVAFVSAASDLVSGDTNKISDVFVRDVQAATTVLASVGAVSTNRGVPLGGSEAPDISADGRYVAFFSTATNLVPGVPPGGDIYLRDLTAGTTFLASAGARPAAQSAFGKTNVISYNHCLSPDGQFIAYETSQAFQSSPTQTAGLILRYNLLSRATDLVASNANLQVGPYEEIRSLDMTPDGRFIAYIAVTNGNSGETTCVEVWDAQTGSLTLASGDVNGLVTTNSTCDWLSLDATGQSITFLSSATGLVTNSISGDYHLYRRDFVSGNTALIDLDTNAVGAGVGPETVPSITRDGRVIAFHCSDGNIVPDDRNHHTDVLVRDLNSATTELVSVHAPSLVSNTPNGNSSLALSSLSWDGRFVVFASDADNLTAQDTNRCRDVFVRDMALRTNFLVSVGTNGFSGNGTSVEPAITPDGRLVVFTSFADNLALGDANQAQDVFLRDLQTGVTTLESMNMTNSGAANGNSYSPLLSSDGRYLLFRSRARDLTSGGFSGENLFLRDRQAGTNVALTRSGIALATMTLDGRFVAFALTNSSTPIVYIWDSRAGIGSLTNTIGTTARPSCIAISPAGNRLAVGTFSGLYYVDVSTGTNQVLDSDSVNYSGLRFSADGNFLVYTKTPAASPSQVYILDVRANSPFLISHSRASTAPGNAASDSPDLSSDNRFVAYRSIATDLLPGGTLPSSPSIFLFDRATGANSLLLLKEAATGVPDNRSLKPLFSGDGRMLCLESWASDLTENDFNSCSDLFVFSFLYAALVPGEHLTSGLLSWPYSPGGNYRVQFKDNLDDPTWQDVPGSITNIANRGFLSDPGSGALHRFYRIRAF